MSRQDTKPYLSARRNSIGRDKKLMLSKIALPKKNSKASKEFKRYLFSDYVVPVSYREICLPLDFQWAIIAVNNSVKMGGEENENWVNPKT